MVFGKLFSKVKSALTKTRDKLSAGLRALLGRRRLDAETLEELEELLLAADIGPEATEEILAMLSAKYKDREIENPDEVLTYLKNHMKAKLKDAGNTLRYADKGPTVILITGVNGVGKTTSIAKLANILRKEGKSVLLCASDTFRAAAIDQLTIWSERLGVDIIKHQPGSDPGAVCFDAMDAALARKVDVVIVDTAGRLHTQTNLMRELEKIKRVIEKKIPGAPHETLLVVDATTGQNGVQQARQFSQAADVSGLFLAKLDGTAKGGIVVNIKTLLGIPVKFVGLGEKIDDVAHFNADEFVDALLE